MSHLIEKLYNSFQLHSTNNCLCIDSKEYTFGEIFTICNKIRFNLQHTSQNVGLYLTYDVEMYASILAIWFEGKTYVPIHPDFPFTRNLNIIEQAEIDTIISSEPISNDYQVKIINTSNIQQSTSENRNLHFIPEDNNAYILFTSGSTGIPKGVPITFSNLYHFVESFNHSFGEIQQTDKVLQMFELTFDMSVFSYLLPWLTGATIVGLNKKDAKFLQILDLLEEDKLTVAFMVPSIINLVKPFLDPEIMNNSLRLNLFAGEPLLAKQIEPWQNFVQNAEIYNTYGPTENTIICTFYKINEVVKERNGILSIGLPMLNNDIRFENNENSEGELLLGGKLLTRNYWKNEQKNKEAFLLIENQRFYKTGDWCSRDEDGNIYFKNRIDFQTKINGFRVELSEIEYFANQINDSILSTAVISKDKSGNNCIILFINSLQYTEGFILNHLKNNLPDYAVPSKVIIIASYPLNTSGKIDRNELNNLIIW